MKKFFAKEIAISVSFAALAAFIAPGAHAQTNYSTGFESGEGFVAGTSVAPYAGEGNTSWVNATNGSTFGEFTSAAAKTGTQSLLITRGQTVNSGVIHGVLSPELLAGTGQGAGSTLSGADYRRFNSSMWVRTAASGTSDPYFMSINAWSNDRMSWVGMDYNRSQTGLAFYASGVDGAGNFPGQQLIAGGLTAGEWYRIDQSILWGANNGAVTFKIFDSANALKGSLTTTTWDNFFTNFAPPVRPVNQLNFRTSADTAGPIAFVDDVSYSVSAAVPEPATWAMMIGGFGMAGSAMRRRSRTIQHAIA